MIKTSTFIKCTLLLFGLIISSPSEAAIVRAIQTGNWESSSTWLLGIQPSNGDSIIIPAGKVVKVTTVADYSGGAAMGLNIFGELTFQTGKKLILPIGSTITLQLAALITPGGGGGNSNIINIGTQLVWNTAMGTLTGFPILPSSPLPVELIDFKAKSTADEQIIITWETATEVNNDYFNVESSSDGAHFEILGRVAGHGTSPVGFKYSFTDILPNTGVNYYRLKQVDFNGKFKYTRTILCKFKPTEKFQVQLYPNPTKGDFFMSIPSDNETVYVEIIIADTKANILLKKQFQNIPGSKVIPITNSEIMLKPGIYIVTITINEASLKRQLVVY